MDLSSSEYVDGSDVVCPCPCHVVSLVVVVVVVDEDRRKTGLIALKE